MTSPPSHSDLQRSLGRLEGNFSALETRMDRLEGLVTSGFDKLERRIGEVLAAHEADSAVSNARIRAIEDRNNELKGAWKVIVTVSTAAGGVAGIVVSAFISWVIG